MDAGIGDIPGIGAEVWVEAADLARAEVALRRHRDQSKETAQAAQHPYLPGACGCGPRVAGSRVSPEELCWRALGKGSTAMFKLKRVYDEPSSKDGLRVLVERLWPRGLSKERAAVGLWLKEVAPSPELRKWFGHDPARWKGFQERYREELRVKKDAVQLLRQKGRAGTVTLVYAARDKEHNGALALKRLL